MSCIRKLPYIFVFFQFIFLSCTEKSVDSCPIGCESVDLDSIRRRGALRVATIENILSYYMDEDGNECGYDYDMSRSFADYLDLEHQLVLATDIKDLVAKVMLGEADIMAYRMQMSSENQSKLRFAANVDYAPMVLVQRREKQQITDVIELIGETVYVRYNSKYVRRMRNLNEELGGGVNVIESSDSVSTEDLITAVSKGTIKYCVADEDVVQLLNIGLQNINFSVRVGFNAPKAWAVSRGNDSLLAEFDRWYEKQRGSRFLNHLYNKYGYTNSYLDKQDISIPKGAISPYDDVFRQEAEKMGWDWRLLAAMAWNESHFNTYAVSSQGAMGVMQMMPRTAAKFGIEGDDVFVPEKNIAAGVQFIKRLDVIFSSVENREERIKFILAGYNAGPGHIFDAMNLAEKYGADPQRWNKNVDIYLLKLNDIQYYQDSLCHHGFFRGKHTVAYVDKVYDKYEEYCALTQQNK